GFGGYMEAGGKALTLERLLAFEALADLLQDGHLLCRPLDHPPAVVGKLQVLDVVSLCGNGGHELLRSRTIERNHVHKGTQPAFNLAAIRLNDAAHTEVLDGERTEDTAVEHAFTQHVIPAVARARDGAEQATGEGITGTGGVAHGFQWVGRREEHAILREEQRSVLTALDDHRARSVGEDDVRRRRQKALARKLHRLFVVDDHAVDRSEERRVGKEWRAKGAQTR